MAEPKNYRSNGKKPSATAITYLLAHQNSKCVPPVLTHRVITCDSFKVLAKLEICPQYTDAPTVGYLTKKLQNSTWYKCLNWGLIGSRTYICMYTHSYRTYIRTKTEKLYAPGIIRCGGHKKPKRSWVTIKK